MDLPAEVQIQNEFLGAKGTKAILIAVHSDGYYEVKRLYNGKTHRILLPIQNTVVIFLQPDAEFEVGVEIER